MITYLRNAVMAVILFSMPNVNFGQAPLLRTTAGFVLFTAAGAFGGTGLSTATGDVGTNAGAFTVFPPGTLTGNKYWADAVTAQAAIDAAALYSDLFGRTCGVVHGVGLGLGEVLGPNVYCMGAASTIDGILTLNGGGDPNAIFIFKIDGTLSTYASSSINVINSASLCNVFWQVSGAVSLGAGSVFRGTIVSGGALNFGAGAILQGRGLSTAGAINLYDNTVTVASCAPPPPPPPTVPTLSEWGLIIFGVLLLGVGTVYIVRRKQTSLPV